MSVALTLTLQIVQEQDKCFKSINLYTKSLRGHAFSGNYYLLSFSSWSFHTFLHVSELIVFVYKHITQIIV